jgi:hypothetical protein
MQRLEVSGAVQHIYIYMSLGVKGLIVRKGDEVYVAITLSRKVAAAEVSHAFKSFLLCLFMYVSICV